MLACAISPAVSQAPDWTRRVSPVRPSPRGLNALAYDAARDRVVLFGGFDGKTYGDTWEWDGFTWTKKTPSSSPSPRRYCAVAYHGATRRVVLFGGNTGQLGSPVYGQTWEWDGRNWTLARPATSPPARWGAAAAYDSTRRLVVMFGGVGKTGTLADTWEWDGRNWIARKPATRPPKQWGHAMAFHARTGRVVLFGRTGTWEWDGRTWSRHSSSVAPVPRSSPAMAYDAARGRVVMFGGKDANYRNYGDTWEWDGARWIKAKPAHSPAKRFAARAVGTGAGITMFGGLDTRYYDDTWEYGVRGHTHGSFSFYGRGCLGSLGRLPIHVGKGHPDIGQTIQWEVSIARPNTSGVVLVGSRSLAINLDSIGARGCWLLVDARADLAFKTSWTGSVSIPVTIPRDPRAIGARVFTQAALLDPGAPRLLKITSTNGLSTTLGGTR